MRVPREQFQEAVRSLHVPERALLGRRHSDCLSLRRLLALGSGAGTLFGVWACSCCRAGGLFAWGPSRAQQPPQAPAQALGQAPQALEQAQLGSPLALAPRAPRAQARAPRRHFPPFLFRKILVFVVQKNRKGNAGAPGVYHISIHVGEFEAQITQSNRAVEPHEMSLVGSGLHDEPYSFVDNELANDVLSEGTLDFGSVCERGTPQKELTKRVHGDEVVDLQGAVDETWPQKVVDGERPAGRGARRVAPCAGELAPELVVVQHAAVPVVGDLDLVGLRHVGGRGIVGGDPGPTGKVTQLRVCRASSIQ